jgi:TonB C terminal
MKDGKIADVLLAESSGDVALDRAAYGGVTESSPLPPLPSAFSCTFLTLRFRFYYNPGQSGDFPRESPVRQPCVTTAIRMGGEIGVTVSPTSAQVTVGAGQQFSAAVTGDGDSAVSWSVGGSGCAATTCGIISGDGLYTAPLSTPNPATVIVTATLAASPSQTASATVTIVPPSSALP